MSKTPSSYGSERKYENYEERTFSGIRTIRERLLQRRQINK